MAAKKKPKTKQVVIPLESLAFSMVTAELERFNRREDDRADAEAFANYAKAASDLKALAGTPAGEALFNAAVTEMTLITRRRHQARLAPNQGVMSL